MNEAAKLREQLEEAKGVIEEQNRVLIEMSQPPFTHSTVLAINGDTVTISNGSSLAETGNQPALDLKPGDTVLTTDTGYIMRKFNSYNYGRMATVTRLLSHNQAEISDNGAARVVSVSHLVTELEEGAKVVMDLSNNVIIRSLAAEKVSFDFTQDTGVTWDSIGGQNVAKRELIEAVELPIKQAAIFKHYGKRQTKGIMLFGPPGCGKTMFGKAAATAIAAATGNKEAGAFMYVKGPELLDPYVGAAEASIRELFNRARAHKQATGTPAVIFIDEADAILGRRGERHTMMEKTIVPTFLTEMDGLEDSGALIILATNRPDTLDSAITRDGRIDRKVRVGRPTQEDALAIFQLYLANVPLNASTDLAKASTVARDALFNSAHVFYQIETGEVVSRFGLSNLISGAMIAGVVDQAISAAMHRDIANNGEPSGVGEEDLLAAVQSVYEQNRNVDHRDAMEEHVDGREITNLRRLSA